MNRYVVTFHHIVQGRYEEGRKTFDAPTAADALVMFRVHEKALDLSSKTTKGAEKIECIRENLRRITDTHWSDT